jgi:sugar (pentulose or hexulose) kinase
LYRVEPQKEFAHVYANMFALYKKLYPALNNLSFKSER